MNLSTLRIPNAQPWTSEQWDRIRAAGIQYEQEVKEPWEKAQRDTRELARQCEAARARGQGQEAERLYQEILKHPSMVSFLAIQKTALDKRSKAFPKD